MVSKDNIMKCDKTFIQLPTRQDHDSNYLKIIYNKECGMCSYAKKDDYKCGYHFGGVSTTLKRIFSV